MRATDFSVKDALGHDIALSQYAGKVLLMVNVASHCGFTGQYAGLEELQKKFPKDFSVLAFPCNQFGNQEPEDNQEIQKFCQMKFHVSFPVFAKIDVNGKDRHPLYSFLVEQKKGFLGTEGIKWNFTKFLIAKDGSVLERFSPQTEPVAIQSRIQEALK